MNNNISDAQNENKLAHVTDSIRMSHQLVRLSPDWLIIIRVLAPYTQYVCRPGNAPFHHYHVPCQIYLHRSWSLGSVKMGLT